MQSMIREIGPLERLRWERQELVRPRAVEGEEGCASASAMPAAR